MDYISFNNIVYHPKINKLANFKIDTNKFKIITNLIDLTLLKIKNKTLLDYFIKQMFFNPIIINIINNINIEDLVNSYFNIKKYLARYINDNLQNIYILILNDLYKYVLCKYYIPISKDTLSNFAINTIEDFYNLNKYSYFKKIYESNLKWIPKQNYNIKNKRR